MLNDIKKLKILYENEKYNGDGCTIKDNYHTMSELYFQRLILFSVLSKTELKKYFWKSKKHFDGSDIDDYFIVGVDTPIGGYSFHFSNKYYDLFDCIELEKGKKFDGHQPSDIYRLLSFFK